MKATPNLRTDYKPYQLRLRISHKGKRTFINMGEFLDLNQFSTKVIRHPRAREINNRIEDLQFKVRQLYLSGENDVNKIKRLILNEKESTCFYEIFEERIRNDVHLCSAGHIRRIRAVLNKMKVYCSELDIHDIDIRFIRNYEGYLYSIGNKKNTVASNLAVIRSTYNRAMEFMEDLKNPFQNYKLKTESGKEKFLTLEQIEKIENTHCLGKIRKAKDLYLFSFYTAGTRWSDICTLEKESIRDGRYHYRMGKNGKIQNILLTDKALEITKRYNGKYLFDVIPYGLSKEEKQRQINSKNTTVNNNLAKLSLLAGVPKFTFHTARHTFANLCDQKDINIRVIQKMLRHSKLETTIGYMARFSSLDTDEAQRKIFG